MAASAPTVLSKKSQEGFKEYYKSIQELQNTDRSLHRSMLESRDRMYQREVDLTAENIDAKLANAMGDANRAQNITIPVVMPQVEAAVTHQASVFLSGHPIFGVVSDPEYINDAKQLEAIIEDQSIRGGWAKQLIQFFRDGFKYNFAPLEISWDNEVTASVETDLIANPKEGVPKEIIWSGNKILRLDPYNTFVDRSVPANEVYYRGDYAGYTRLISRIELKAIIARLPDKIVSNITPAFESGIGAASGNIDAGSMSYYVPSINPEVDIDNDLRGGTNWLRWAGFSNTRNKNISYKDSYEITVLYGKILPSEFEIITPNSKTPQIYKLIIVNHEHIIYAERQTNAHGYIPILVGMPNDDGLSYQTKSLADNAGPFQSLASTYMNSIIASRRRSISDRSLFDPSRITSAAINSANPAAKIPVRPAAYGTDISKSVYAFPYREDQQAASMQQIQMLLGLSNQLAGQNQASQGQFVKGNRTLHEFESVMQNSNSRDQLAAIVLEHQVFVPLKHILKINILQFQGGTTIYNREQKKNVNIDPVALRKAVLEFEVSDGLIPTDKLINAEALGIAFQTISNTPAISQGYNIAPLFSYLMKTQGAEIEAFEKSPEQIAYEQALNAWQNAVMMLVEKGGDPKSLGPQPIPEQFGYAPANNSPKPPTDTPTTARPQTAPTPGAQ